MDSALNGPKTTNVLSMSVAPSTDIAALPKTSVARKRSRSPVAAKARPCEAFSPEQIPIRLYTHINFAFATIDPKTFEIKPDKESDIRIYKHLTELKRLDPKLKVYIAYHAACIILVSETIRHQEARKKVDFFNIMSYDLHGAWDQGKNYTQPFLNVHSNLTEIDLALDLLWRNNIQSDKVVLGMGFYGRAFSVQSGTCTKPGCLFKAAGKASNCSREKGILLNSEIITTIKKYNIKPKFFKEEAIKAISHDTKEARFNKALALLLNRKTTSGDFNPKEKAYKIKKIPNEQCRWTNCKEGYRKGWVPVPRSDSGARKNEIMFDETGCSGDGGHTFCCPAGSTKMPTCGWYGHNNGRCPVRSECPSDMTEIASNEIYCKKQKGSKKQNFQTACCKTDVVGTKVYGTCEWGQYPKCDAQEGCPNPLGNKKMGSLLAYSASGSGGGNCDDAKNELGLNVPGVQYRKFCCNDSDKNLRFTDCQKFRNVGPVPDVMPRDFCRSGCPPDRIQVAIDTQVDTCAIAGVGGMAHCCKTDYAEIFEVENPKIDAFENDVKAWIKNPTCPKDDGGLFKRFDPLNDTTMVSSLSMGLSPRAKEMEDSYDLVILLARLIAGLVSKEVAEALTPKWNLVVEEEYPNLVVRTLQEAKNSVPEWEDEDPEVMSRVTICDPKRANARIAAILGKGSDGRTLAFNCTNTICQNGVCEPFTPEAARRRRGLSTSRASHSASHLHYHLHARQAGAEHNEVPLRDRGGGEATIEYNIPAHDEPKKLALRNPDAQVVDFANEADCHETKLWYTTWSVGLENMGFQTEHLIDKVILKRFFLDAGFGTLRSGAQSTYHGIPVRFWEEALRLGELYGGFPDIDGRGVPFDNQNVLTRIFECLGSQTNFRNFVIIVGPINSIKARVMQLFAPVAENRLETYDTDRLMSQIRTVISLFEYMGSEEGDENGETVRTKINKIVNNIVNQLDHAQDLWNNEHPGRPVPAVKFFVEWLEDYFEEAGRLARAWLREAIAQLRERKRAASGARAEEIRLAIVSFESQMIFVRIVTDWDIPLLEDEDETSTGSD
ncbi:hypothetical protein BFJ63_vAg16188 [Fusarium oxysporum f. sp. narcissi]|uniref:chitinase n=1 Tax=Fusarium oxysporum f. sp. narcissi TaxID=451672 RepID=A0A4Q2V3R6_FUSOX|nr:hypothetical protein BFJ63_vAg16188 [Fusarium oxysporum f. sp. narcissi]